MARYLSLPYVLAGLLRAWNRSRQSRLNETTLSRPSLLRLWRLVPGRVFRAAGKLRPKMAFYTPPISKAIGFMLKNITHFGSEIGYQI